MIKTKYWIILFVLLLIVSGVFAVILMTRPAESRVAGIYQNGILLYEINLDTETKPREFTIYNGESGNTIRVDSQGICIIRADCPDQTCVHHGYLADGAPIICLPNRLTIKWIDGDSAYDAVTGTK
jgi:hypothetical protein